MVKNRVDNTENLSSYEEIAKPVHVYSAILAIPCNAIALNTPVYH